MPKELDRPARRRHIIIYDDDWEFLEKHYGADLGTGPAVRNIVAAQVAKMKAKIQERIDAAQLPRSDLYVPR